nr:RNA-directed DNA polymerase, eukaryota, reverse transcriptase zinc-binding domain protein [Tanacetum cinerariifolium]
MDLKDVAQKAKVNWAIEGDENSKFFYGVIIKRRSQLAILGVFVSGDWYTNPSKVKEAFYDHFVARFKQPSRSRLKLSMPFPNRLSHDQVGDLDNDISLDEISKVVWDCCFSRGGNSSFIALIPKVMDAKFVSDFRSIRLIGSVYKVVTKIIANRLATVISDLVSNTQSAFDFLLDVLLAFGFGPKWCQWIRGIFSSNMASILVNRSPTFEFPIFSGLKQGLSINMNKSHLLGVGVPLDIVYQGASRSRWTLLKSVLGAVPIYNMSLYKAPKSVLHEMERLRNNFFNGGDSQNSKITWVAWVKVLSSKKNGGLGVAIYGSRLECHSHKTHSSWGVMLREVHQLALKGFDFPSHCKIRIGDGLNTRFWLDTWTLDLPLCVRFPRLFALEFDKEILVVAKWGAPSFDEPFRRQVRDGVERNQWSELLSLLGMISLSPSSDRYFCDLNGDGVFRVKDIRFALDELFLPSSDVATRWVKFVPIKVNI